MTLTESQRTGIFYTLLIHACILVLLLMLKLSADKMFQAEEGLLVDFGYSETGKGDEEPSAVYSKNDNIQKAPVLISQKAANTPAPAYKPAPIKAENLLTQEHEPSVALHTTPKVQKKTVEKKIIDPSVEIEKQRKREQLAQQQAEEQKLQKKLKEEKMIGNIYSRATKAFGGGLSDNGSTSKGEGITYGPGNQGDSNGQPGVKKYGPGGGTGINISPDLSRRVLSLKKPDYPGNESGKVVVEVSVDKIGKIIAVSSGIQGSNTTNSDLVDAAKKAALATKFGADPSAAPIQKGTITYNFVLK